MNVRLHICSWAPDGTTEKTTEDKFVKGTFREYYRGRFSAERASNKFDDKLHKNRQLKNYF